MGRVGLGFRKRFAKVECDELTQILTLNCYVSARRGACRSGFSGISQLIILENFTVFPTHFSVKWVVSHFGANRKVARRLRWKNRNLGACRSGSYERAKEIIPPSNVFIMQTACTQDLHAPKITGVRPFAKPFAGLRVLRLGNYPQASTRNCTRDSSSISTACARFRGQTYTPLQSFDCVWTEESEKGIGCTRGLYFSLAVQVNSRA